MTDRTKDMAVQEAPFSPAQYVEETTGEKMRRKYRESPFMVFGLGGCVLACAYGAYIYRRRKYVTTSLFLMQLRVAAQGSVVGCLTLGIAYKLFQRFTERHKEGSTADKS